MEKIRRIFFEQKMTWKKVLAFAILSGAITGGLNLISIFKDTSFQDIAINLECWILFAIIIILNCNKWWEAAIKTFVFFLISQPIVYLVEVPFNSLGFGIFMYYRYWFIMTLLTLPGSIIAYYVKKKNFLSAIILLVATGFIGFMAATYFWEVVVDFPRHLLSLVFCLILCVGLPVILLNKKIHRAFVLGITSLVIVIALFRQRPIRECEIQLEKGAWEYTIEDENIVYVNEKSADIYQFKIRNNGITLVTFQNENGDKVEYSVTGYKGSIYVDLID